MNGWRRGRVVIAGGVAAGCLAAGVQAQAGPINFDYRVSGDRQARPVQVFDDGRRTYFQFAAGSAIPVLFAGGDGQAVLPEVEGPYHVVDGVPGVFRLQLAVHRARVEPHGAAAAAGPSGAPEGGRATPGGYAVPVRGDSGGGPPRGDADAHVVVFDPRQAAPGRRASAQLQRWLMTCDPEAAYLVTAGRGELASRRQRFVVQALVTRGVRPTRIALARTDDGVHDAADAVSIRPRDGGPAEATPSPTASDGRPLPNRFDLLLTDRTVADALHRWARHAGYRVDWQATVQAPVTGEVTLAALTFPEAAAQVIAGLQRAGYPLRLALGADQVARVLPATHP